MVEPKRMPWVLNVQAAPSALEQARGNDNVRWGYRPLNRCELMTIIALVLWRADQDGAEAATVRSALLQRFDIVQLRGLQTRDYDAVVKWLVDGD